MEDGINLFSHTQVKYRPVDRKVTDATLNTVWFLILIRNLDYFADVSGGC